MREGGGRVKGGRQGGGRRTAIGLSLLGRIQEGVRVERWGEERGK